MLYAIAAGDAVIRWGAISGAAMAIVGLIAMVLRFSVKQFVRAVKDELSDVTPKIDKVYANTLELKPNGGSSLADAVRRLEVRQLELHSELAAQRDALLDHLRDHKRIA